MTSHDAPFSKKAINIEIDSIMSNHIWEIVNVPPSTKAIGCKWIFKRS